MRRTLRQTGIGACVFVVVLFLFLKRNEIIEISPFRESLSVSEFPLASVPSLQPEQSTTILKTTTFQNPSPNPVSNTLMHRPTIQVEDKPQEPLKNVSHTNKTLAVMTTVLNPDPTFSVWLDYHLRRFTLVIIFLDDPSEQPMLERLVEGKPVVFFNGSTEWSDSTPDRIILRQQANVNAALAYALTKNITWLLHIDTDELFYEDGDRSWENWDHVGSIQFINHEAVALRHEIVNFFEECTIFRLDGGGTTFMAYIMGKSVVRVTPGASAAGPHLFEGYQGEKIDVRVPMILHYSTPTFDRWVEKYKLYGNFSDVWFHDPDRPIIHFMATSRDLVHAAVASGNWDEARKFYYSWIPDNATTERYLSEGAFRRITPLTDMR